MTLYIMILYVFEENPTQLLLKLLVWVLRWILSGCSPNELSKLLFQTHQLGLLCLGCCNRKHGRDHPSHNCLYFLFHTQFWHGNQKIRGMEEKYSLAPPQLPVFSSSLRGTSLASAFGGTVKCVWLCFFLDVISYSKFIFHTQKGKPWSLVEISKDHQNSY